MVINLKNRKEMKKIIYTMGAALVMLASVSCKKNDAVKGDEQSSVKRVEMEFTATSKGALKTTVKPDGTTVVWSEGDAIKVFTASDTQGSTLSLKSGDGKSTAVFSGPCSETGPWMAIYPSSMKDLSYVPAGSVSSVGFTMPATQTYAGATFASGAMPSVSLSETTSLSFQHTFGVLKLQLKGEGSVKSITVTDKTDNSKLNGYFVVNPEQMGYVALKLPDDVKATASITLDCGAGVALNTSTATEFWFVVPQGAFTSGFDAVITSTDGKTAELSTTNNNVITAGYIRPMPEKTIEFKAQATTTGEAEITGGTKVKWVQLWENGPKFAEYDVGEDTGSGSYGCGGYFAWKGNKTRGSQETVDDTATALWGSNWRMPSDAEFQALIDNCDAEWTSNYNSTGKAGRVYTGKAEGYTGNSVFFPAAGSCRDGAVMKQGSEGLYWSSTPTPDGSTFAYGLNFTSGIQLMNKFNRSRGYSVRAVLK